MRRTVLLPIIMVASILTACQTAPAATPIATPTVIPPMDTLLPTPMPPTPIPTIAPTATLTPTVTLSPTPFAPFDAVTGAVAVRLREGPGFLFPTLRVLKESTTVTVLGKAPGGNWIRVRISEAVVGWLYRFLLQANVDLQQAPIVQPQNFPRIEGRLLDGNGTPIRGVGFNLVQGNGITAITDNASTDSSGEFFAFLPADSAGTWTVGYSAVACDSNVWIDNECTTYKIGYKGQVYPPSVNVTLPSTGVLEFTWK